MQLSKSDFFFNKVFFLNDQNKYEQQARGPTFGSRWDTAESDHRELHPASSFSACLHIVQPVKDKRVTCLTAVITCTASTDQSMSHSAVAHLLQSFESLVCSKSVIEDVLQLIQNPDFCLKKLTSDQFDHGLVSH